MRRPSRQALRHAAPASQAAARVAPRVAAGAAAPLLPSAEDDAHLKFLLEAIRDRDQAALARFYDITVSRVHAVALRIVRDASLAEETVSDVYLQAWRDAARYDAARGRVLGWLLVMARTRALDALRRRDEAFSHPEPHELVDESEDGRGDLSDLLAATRAGTALHAALKSLQPLPRQLLALAFFRGLTHSEIADATGIPLGTVKTHIRRALAALKDVLGDEAGTLQLPKQVQHG